MLYGCARFLEKKKNSPDCNWCVCCLYTRDSTSSLLFLSRSVIRSTISLSPKTTLKKFAESWVEVLSFGFSARFLRKRISFSFFSSIPPSEVKHFESFRSVFLQETPPSWHSFSRNPSSRLISCRSAARPPFWPFKVFFVFFVRLRERDFLSLHHQRTLDGALRADWEQRGPGWATLLALHSGRSPEVLKAGISQPLLLSICTICFQCVCAPWTASNSVSLQLILTGIPPHKCCNAIVHSCLLTLCICPCWCFSRKNPLSPVFWHFQASLPVLVIAYSLHRICVHPALFIF